MTRSIQPPWWGDCGLQLLTGLTLWTAAQLGNLNWLPSAGVTAAALLLWSATLVLVNGPPRWMLALCFAGPLLLLTALHADGVALGTLAVVLGIGAAWGIHRGSTAALDCSSAAADMRGLPVQLIVQPPTSILRENSDSGSYSDHLVPLDEELDSEVENLDDALILQQWERRRDAEGGESVSGTSYVELAANEKIRLLHLPIHPPVPGELEATLELLDGDSLVAELDLLRPYGLRIIVRRTVPLGTAVAGTVGFFVARSSQRRAA